MDPIIWSIICCILMVIAVVLELFTPSFGILTCLGVGLIIASVWLAFSSQYGPSSGFVMLAANLALFPMAIIIGMQFMKSSPLAHRGTIPVGRAIEPQKADAEPDLVGEEGTCLTPLRPSGTVQVGERRVEVVSDGKFVEAGCKVRVLRVDGNIIKVEPIEDAESA